MATNNKVTKVIEETVDRVATTAEGVHKSIADLPLKILEQSDILRPSAKEIRRVVDRSIGALYDVIRDVNQKVGTLASDLLADAEAEPRRHRSPSNRAKKHAAPATSAH